eukprot:3116448-Prymnesium_polylepis.1
MSSSSSGRIAASWACAVLQRSPAPDAVVCVHQAPERIESLLVPTDSHTGTVHVRGHTANRGAGRGYLRIRSVQGHTRRTWLPTHTGGTRTHTSQQREGNPANK